MPLQFGILFNFFGNFKVLLTTIPQFLIHPGYRAISTESIEFTAFAHHSARIRRIRVHSLNTIYVLLRFMWFRMDVSVCESPFPVYAVRFLWQTVCVCDVKRFVLIILTDCVNAHRHNSIMGMGFWRNKWFSVSFVDVERFRAKLGFEDSKWNSRTWMVVCWCVGLGPVHTEIE